MDPSIDTPRTSRRRLLQAAGAAGIVWAAPVVRSVTAHAAGNCTRVQFDEDVGCLSAVTPTDSDEDFNDGQGCTACLPGGQVYSSTCVCAGTWSAVVSKPSDFGLVTCDSFANPLTYTAPSGCSIVDATLLVEDTNGSGCSAFSCRTIGSGITISGAFSQLTSFGTFTATQYGIRLRVLLCCN